MFRFSRGLVLIYYALNLVQCGGSVFFMAYCKAIWDLEL